MTQIPSLTRLLLLNADPAGASTCLHIDAGGRILSRSQVDAAQPLPAAAGTRDVLAVPAAALHLLWIELPAHSAAQALAAARLMLEDLVAGPRENLHVALGEFSADAQRLLAVVDDQTMRGWLQRATQLGLQAQAVVPDCLLLDEAQDDSVQACERDGRVLARGKRLALAAEPDLARRVIGERPLRWLDAAEAEACLAAHAIAPPAIDLLQGAHARGDGKSPRQRRRLRLLAALVLLSPLLLVAAQTAYHALAAHRLQARADALAARFQPGLDAGRLHAHYTQRVAADVLAVHSARLFEALRGVPGARLDSYEFSPDGGLRAGLLHPREADLETLRQQLADNGLELIALDSQPVDAGLRSLVAVEPLQ
ncbi:type II secretion system protein GspL [Stenotrophomonas sp. MMGLT7]|uniref:type II secretion system protein GspL n=1 Tax=Stenotrophomonas sp. MMGLT7 TaxID=2901227 RepID=UPI001E55DEB2|nr:type II secretion system protein GspL [Stenotrophomonas sp. MMGLT7]MCD7098950.1 type II secretion system protein GspL [Stenotrophomonas sp. MMGLT7]